LAATASGGSRLLAALRFLAIAGWLAFCAACHLVARNFGTSPWPRRLLAGVAWIVGAQVRTRGSLPNGATLIVANHVSWLDIPMLAGATNCSFVAKDGLRAHPFMRWLCKENGNVFVDRDDRGTIGDQLGAIAAALGSPKPLTLFPEGTVGENGRMLPFRSSLLKIAEQPPLPITIQPVAIDYGRHAPEFGWPQGESGVANFLRLLGRRGRVTVTLHLLEPLGPDLNRKQLARTAQTRIQVALVPSGAAAPPV
jgi:lyso-ornithine lipid O-acyltransferase